MSASVVDAGDGLPLTVPALLRARVARGDHPLLICDDETLTYAEADARSAELADALLGLGAGPGTHVGLLYPNGAAFVVAWLAAARIGAITIPLSTFSTSAELRTLLVGPDIEILLATPSFRGRDYVAAISEAVPGFVSDAPQPLFLPSVPALRHVLLATDPTCVPNVRQAHNWYAGSQREALEKLVRPSDRMVIVHTSGSTSEPKGVIHQHGPLIRHIDNLNELRRYSSNEVLFSNSPFFWIGGFAYSLLGTLLAGATLVCTNATDATDAAAALDVLERARPTMVNGFAASVAHLAADPSFAARDLSSIRRGNLWPIMPPDVRAADPELRHNMLGMTEAGSVCLASDDEGDQPEARRGSFGKPVPGFEARVVDPDTGVDCATGVVGELWFRGPFLMEGYYGRERHETFTPDGWYRTGDLFRVDADGFFYFTGRRGDMIKTAGANVSPREVEAAILDESGLVAHVLGIADPERGQVVAAAVRANEPVDVDGLRAALRTRLSAYKVPKRWLVLADDEVPMMSSGKLDPRALRALFQ
jgi:acyl-CoA synthetase (AMP-forming)/AMP-acid ligase II